MRNFGLYFAAVSVALLVAVSGSHAKAEDGDNPGIVGTWVGTGTVETPPGSPPFVFTDLIAFSPGGTFTETNGAFNFDSSQNPFLPPPLTADYGEGYGAWKQLDDPNRFAATFKRLLFAGSDTPAALYGPFFLGQQVGVATINSIVNLDGADTLEGTFTFQLTNRSGQVVFTGRGTISFTRLMIERLK